ncbi:MULTISPECIES: capsular polyglutamate synthetase CapA [Bacillus]|uniref:Capsule biosynthesis protein CapA n=8 Tax=Bacillaceae TaxID=186817 RepID=CAPA_BACAN|nr:MULTISPECIES: capsular polyglutamate synthetase CapA [Bacillus]P19579.2 RecName: Full=Capsule biosynthesis protein CapA [Bacillus anthracis]AAM26220.1 capsule biosynthesis protein CapA, (pXO2-56) [Bacillus anthracis str. A2012]ABG25872.1 putative CapA [Bacillus sp. CBD 118]ABG25875.1 putative CapA [Bacillus sp. CBD119]ARO21830.1 capsule biosynthesis protein CapA [Bacillus cereus]EJT17282.1 Capsule biosynthesis protein capA [Bacillus anthracis str. UR-1]HDR4494985.1 capsular polyglutamate 
MRRKLTFQEKLLIFIKKTKKKNPRYVAIVLPLIAVILIAATWVQRTEAVAPVKHRENEKLTMTMVGDIMMGRHVKEIVNRYGTDYVFRHVSPYLKNSDYVSGNFEHPVLLEDKKNYQKADKNIHLSAKEETVKAVKEAGFTVLNLANNHMTDYGAKGTKDTIKAFKEADLDYVGAGENFKDVKNIVYQNVNGVRVATLGFTDAFVAGAIATKEQPGSLSMNPDVLLKQISKAKDPKKGNADLVVVNTHWGEEYDNKPSPRQEALAKAMVDAGADIIVGHHPHVLQSFDVYKQGIIFYSLGNFVFDQGWTRTKDSALVQYHLRDNGTAILDVVPLNIQEGSPKPVTSALDKNRVYRQLTKDTSKGALWSKKDDKLEIKLNHKHVIEKMKKREKQEHQDKQEKENQVSVETTT